eukprot:NODE_14897_length_1079_cov_2.882353.p1 GENE.NODE_14897_length_1079_cov_2.882353~~NODE_14897_length_1079_cov_2.882353.p1  ORF type:complete len:347 (-),score=9.37 NODE_14897_length_1079_cov_2.882353:39-1079(-)
MLLKAHLDGAKEKDVSGTLSLDRGLLYRASDTVIEMLFKAHPDAAKEKDGYGMLPLHRALKILASDTVIEMLFKAHPYAVKLHDVDGMLPLHRALKIQASDTVIEMLFKAHPNAAKELGGYTAYGPYGALPLQLALKFQASDTVIEMLLRAHPDAAKQNDVNGTPALHTALESQASDTVFGMLLKAHPGAAKEKPLYGMLPLHRASRDRASDAVIEMLSGLANLSISDIASLVHDVSPGHACHGKFPRLFPIVSACATTLGSFASVTSALMAMSWVGPYSLEEGLRLSRVWHHGGKLWKMCIERTFGQFLPRSVSHTISNFVCGECACELCCRPRPAAEAAPGADK